MRVDTIFVELGGAHPLVIGEQRDDLIVVSTDPSQGATAAVDDDMIADGPGDS